MQNKREQFEGDGRECIHHWLIDASNFGVCKKCGTSKQFCSWLSSASIQRGLYPRSGGQVQHGVRGSNS
jgi:hypothetical protein